MFYLFWHVIVCLAEITRYLTKKKQAVISNDTNLLISLEAADCCISEFFLILLEALDLTLKWCVCRVFPCCSQGHCKFNILGMSAKDCLLYYFKRKSRILGILFRECI